MKKVIISDVDGTLVKGSLVLNHACYLHTNKIIDLEDLPTRWKRSKKNENRITELAEAYRESIVGKTAEDLHVKDFVKNLVNDPNNFYSSVPRLAQLKQTGWNVFLISGSPSYLLTPFARSFGFRSKGSLYRKNDDGAFTGECVGMFGAEAKRKHIGSLKIHPEAKVLAFGDTMSDLPLFERANYSVLVDPNKATITGVGKVDEIIRG